MAFRRLERASGRAVNTFCQPIGCSTLVGTSSHPPDTGNLIAMTQGCSADCRACTSGGSFLMSTLATVTRKRRDKPMNPLPPTTRTFRREGGIPYLRTFLFTEVDDDRGMQITWPVTVPVHSMTPFAKLRSVGVYIYRIENLWSLPTMNNVA
jgi:hypothetical protein